MLRDEENECPSHCSFREYCTRFPFVTYIEHSRFSAAVTVSANRRERPRAMPVPFDGMKRRDVGSRSSSGVLGADQGRFPRVGEASGVHFEQRRCHASRDSSHRACSPSGLKHLGNRNGTFTPTQGILALSNCCKAFMYLSGMNCRAKCAAVAAAHCAANQWVQDGSSVSAKQIAE